MNKTFYPSFHVVLLAVICALTSCSKSSPGYTGPVGGGNPDTATVPANVVDIKSNNGTSTITLNPYPGYPPVSSLIANLTLGYYFIVLQDQDTMTFAIQADFNGGGNAGLSGQTSDTGPNFFISGDSLQYLVTLVSYSVSLGGTGMAYYTNDLEWGYTLNATDTSNFSDVYGGAQLYWSSLNAGTGYNLYNIESYIAFRLKNSQGYRYGWMQASSDPAAGTLLSVYEIAFNTNYNQPLPIGKYR